MSGMVRKIMSCRCVLSCYANRFVTGCRRWLVGSS